MCEHGIHCEDLITNGGTGQQVERGVPKEKAGGNGPSSPQAVRRNEMCIGESTLEITKSKYVGVKEASEGEGRHQVRVACNLQLLCSVGMLPVRGGWI